MKTTKPARSLDWSTSSDAEKVGSSSGTFTLQPAWVQPTPGTGVGASDTSEAWTPCRKSRPFRRCGALWESSQVQLWELEQRHWHWKHKTQTLNIISFQCFLFPSVSNDYFFLRQFYFTLSAFSVSTSCHCLQEGFTSVLANEKTWLLSPIPSLWKDHALSTGFMSSPESPTTPEPQVCFTAPLIFHKEPS